MIFFKPKESVANFLRSGNGIIFSMQFVESLMRVICVNVFDAKLVTDQNEKLLILSNKLEMVGTCNEIGSTQRNKIVIKLKLTIENVTF